MSRNKSNSSIYTLFPSFNQIVDNKKNNDNVESFVAFNDDEIALIDTNNEKNQDFIDNQNFFHRQKENFNKVI
jgi:hypothetical protein